MDETLTFRYVADSTRRLMNFSEAWTRLELLDIYD
jgi:hypothetical protein